MAQMQATRIEKKSKEEICVDLRLRSIRFICVQEFICMQKKQRLYPALVFL